MSVLKLASPQKKSYFVRLRQNIRYNYELYILSLPVFLYFLIFHYGPMYGIQIAFKEFTANLGIIGSPWVGFEHFIRFFKSNQFWLLLKNTIGISAYQLVLGFPCPIILALMLNEVRHIRFKKTVQMITYAPHFISVVVLVGIIQIFLSPTTGLFNHIITYFGGEAVPFLSKPEYFKTIYVLSGIWQSVGWSSIIYMATLAGIDQQLHEAAKVDGASKLQRIINIDLPGILPTAVIILIMNTGHIMSVGFEKVFLMQNPLNQISSDVISTFVYRSGIRQGEFSFSSAIGLFNSIVNCILLLTVNKVSNQFSGSGLW